MSLAPVQGHLDTGHLDTGHLSTPELTGLVARFCLVYSGNARFPAIFACRPAAAPTLQDVEAARENGLLARVGA